MKLRPNFGTIIATMLLGVLTLVSGCATTGMQRSEKTGNTMKSVEADIQQAVVQVDVTAAALDDLVRPGQADVRKAYQNYADNVDKMQSQGKRLFEHAEKMNAQGKEYFEEWQKQGNTYSSNEIQSLSEQRRADLAAVFVKISESSVGVKRAYMAYLSSISEIRTYLSNDLTPKGVESITPVAQKAIQDGNSLKEAVRPVLSAIGNARAELAQGGTK